MFDLDRQVLRWREREERNSPLSPRELDELEDHLRARVDLELELNAALAPTRAFAIARRELGKATALSREFTKAGKPRWRRWLVAGWAMFAASFVLPVVEPFPGDRWAFGWEAAIVPFGIWSGLGPPETLGDAVAVLSSLTNLLMLVTLLRLRGARPPRTRWLTGLVTGAATINLSWLAGWAEPGAGPLLGMGIGYWAWVASFFCVAAALWMRAGERKPSTPEPISSAS